MTDPTAVLHSHLASALSTLGDAQYWEESIAPQEIRRSLQDADPSSSASVPALLKGMKWLLANISKGRDVSDFYVQVVKLVGCNHMEVRKMVYTYLVQYADYSQETRELSLLSINSFQRGLRDAEPLIRALALRVLTSVQLPDILAIQVLAVTQHAANDTSPYVRKCAAMAVSKLYGRCDREQQAVLWELLQQLLDHDPTTMVLSSALIAFGELTSSSATATATATNNNDCLHMLHGSYRKLCHLLTDMDEWGQVVALDLLTRYARRFFRQPRHHGPLGSASQIDATRRVTRTVRSERGGGGDEGFRAIAPAPTAKKAAAPNDSNITNGGTALAAANAGVTLPPHARTTNNQQQHRKIIKRRVVKKGFYSDEEDESTEEEVFADTLEPTSAPLSAQLRQPEFNSVSSNLEDSNLNVTANNNEEEVDLDEDHRLLLHSARPLLKSRNAGVVLAVCALHYYAGVCSVPIFQSMGQALVRLQRSDRRRPEIQYVVLTSIRRLVRQSPSAFGPFLPDFFVLPDMDPPFTRLIKLDILTALALDPPSIEAVLRELRTYVHHTGGAMEEDAQDLDFVVRAVAAVGRVVELARIVYGRQQRPREAQVIALNALYGLWTLSQATAETHERVLGACVVTMQRILQMLLLSASQNSDTGNDNSAPAPATTTTLHDPNGVTDRALRRILVLLLHTLSCLGQGDDDDDDENDDFDIDNDDDNNDSDMGSVARVLPPGATASTLWLLGEYLSSKQQQQQQSQSTALNGMSHDQLRTELVRLLVRCFMELEAPEKEQAVHLASKFLVSSNTASSSNGSAQQVALCEQLLALGRLDVNPDVRDRARFESGLVHATVGLRHDRDGLDENVTLLNNNNKTKLSIHDAQRIFLQTKPVSSYLPLELTTTANMNVEQELEGDFRFGTLSSLVGHRARTAYQPLPPWAAENSPSSLREPPAPPQDRLQAVNGGAGGKFYNDGESSSTSVDDSSGSSSSSSESADDGDNESSSSSSDSSSSDTDSDDGDRRVGVLLSSGQPVLSEGFRGGGASAPQQQPQRDDSSSSSSSSSSDDGSSSFSSGQAATGDLLSTASAAAVGNLISMGGGASNLASSRPAPTNGGGSTSVADDLKGLVLEPLVGPAEPTDSNFDRDSGAWLQLIRPEHAKGLSVQARFLRGVTKSQQAQKLGLTSDKPTVVCLQIRCENLKNGSSGPIRHIRILQRSVSSSGSIIAPRRVVLPPEINQVGMGQRIECLVGFDFASASDRDGSLHAKLEIKFGSSGMPIEIKPSIGDLLLPCRQTVAQFDAALGRMHGFNRVESKFSVASRDLLPQKLLSRVALSFVGSSKLTWDGDKLRLVGSLPASSDPVYVLATCAASSQQGKVLVCCDHALVVNSIMNLIKRAIAEVYD